MTDRTREALIEKAAKAMHSAMEGVYIEDMTYTDLARAALAVFEQAHTPTSDEREALIEALADDENYIYNGTHMVFNEGYGANRVLAAGFRRTAQGEPSAEEWAARAHAAREKAIARGYTPDHDAEHGIRHLLNWAIDYARRGRAEDSSGLILSALALLDSGPQGEPSGRGTAEALGFREAYRARPEHAAEGTGQPTNRELRRQP